MDEEKFFTTGGLRNERFDDEDQKIVPKQADVPITSYVDVCKLIINTSEIGKEKNFPSIGKMLADLLS